MRVLHLCDYFQSPLGYQEYYLAREHALGGHETYVVTGDRYFPFPDYKRTVQSILGPRICGTGRRVDESGFVLIRLPVALECASRVWLRGLRRTVAEIKPDVLICHNTTTLNALRAARWKRRLGYRLVFDDHIFEQNRRRGWAGRLFYALLPLFLGGVRRAGDLFVPVTAVGADFIHRRYRVPEDRIRLIPLGFDHRIFSYDEEARRAARRDLGAGGRTLVIYTGKILERKGVAAIIRSIARLDGRGDVLFVCVGDGDPALVVMLKSLCAAGGVACLFPGPVSNRETAGYYLAADVAVWPNEPTIGTMEAIGSGTPIIACDYLEERFFADNGIPVRPDVQEDLDRAVKKVVEDPAFLERLKKNTRGGSDDLSWQRLAGRFLL